MTYATAMRLEELTMCGIAGWIDYDRNLEAERSTVEMMTETMSLRGPDAGGVWIKRPRRTRSSTSLSH